MQQPRLRVSVSQPECNIGYEVGLSTTRSNKLLFSGSKHFWRSKNFEVGGFDGKLRERRDGGWCRTLSISQGLDLHSCSCSGHYDLEKNLRY